MKFEIKIDSKNEACATVDDACGMLAQVVSDLRRGRIGGGVLDGNGNRVGE